MIKTIVIDPGHGGNDPGAVNEKLNVKEKDINLDISLKVYKKLKEYDCKVIMTRNTDVFSSLNDRVVVSNKVKADRFVSIHCNSFEKESANGFEVWVYNKKTNENIGADILNAMENNVVGVNRGVKENKKFTVLAKTKCKSTIVEVGFISNMNECKQIINDIDLYVDCIVEGIVKNLKLENNNKCYCTCHK